MIGITIQPLTDELVEPADQLLHAAYGGPSRKERLRRYLELQPDGWLLAKLDGALAGIAGGINYGPVGHIGLVGVDPAKQRRGVAGALMQHLLAWFDARNCSAILLDASEDGAPLYRKLGFVEEEKTIVFQQDLVMPLSTSAAVQLVQPADLPELAAFDAPIFGTARAAVIGACFAEAPERALITRDQHGQIAGYLFAQRQTLGPWVARTPAAAQALLVAALALPFDQASGALVPSSNAAAAALLARAGFSQGRALRRMRRGSSATPGRRDLLYGQASLAIG